MNTPVKFMHECTTVLLVSGSFLRKQKSFQCLTLKTNTDITDHGYFGAAPCETRSAGYPPQLEQKHKYKVQLSMTLGAKCKMMKLLKNNSYVPQTKIISCSRAVNYFI